MQFDKYNRLRDTLMACYDTKNLRKLSYFIDGHGVYIHRYLGKYKYEPIFHEGRFSMFLRGMFLAFGLTESDINSNDLLLKYPDCRYKHNLSDIFRTSFINNNTKNLQFCYSVDEIDLPTYIYDSKKGEVVYSIHGYGISESCRNIVRGSFLKHITDREIREKIRGAFKEFDGG
jgi:hypothetical protein